MFWRMCPRSGFLVLANIRMYLFFPFVGAGEHPNVPSFRFLVPGNMRQNHPFGNHPFANPRAFCGYSTVTPNFPEFLANWP